MKHDIRKTVVLGAGTMGAQVAAHLVAAGIDVVLLDIVPKGLAEGEDRSVLAREAIAGLKKLKPSPLHLPEHMAPHPPRQLRGRLGPARATPTGCSRR